jgi:2-dehydropantoate 2-reductase
MATRQADFAILGAGALGSVIAAHLARAGHSVAVLARGHRAAQLQRDGIRVAGLDSFVQPVDVVTDPSRFLGAKVLVLATKTHGTVAALEPLRGAQIGVALSVQNGLMKNEQLATIFGRGRVLGALANTSGELLADGTALFTRNEQIAIGELDGTLSERTASVARALDESGIRANVVNDIESLEWSKFVSWAGLMIVSVTTRAATVDFLADDDSALVVVRLIRELGRLARASAVSLSDRSTLPVATICDVSEREGVALLQTFSGDLRRRAPLHRMSSLQDLEAGRQLETDETLGYAQQKARALGLELPLMESLYPLVRAISRLGTVAQRDSTGEESRQ